MALSCDSPIRNEPIEVRFAGFRSDTYTMQREGWRMAVERGNSYDLVDQFFVAFKNDNVGVAMHGVCILSPGGMFDSRHAVININRVSSNITNIHMQSREMDLREVDATPMFMANINQRALFEMPFFQSINVPQAEPLIVDPETVIDLMDRIRKMQSPAQKEVRENNARRQPEAGKIHAHIMSIAA